MALFGKSKGFTYLGDPEGNQQSENKSTSSILWDGEKCKLQNLKHLTIDVCAGGGWGWVGRERNADGNIGVPRSHSVFRKLSHPPRPRLLCVCINLLCVGLVTCINSEAKHWCFFIVGHHLCILSMTGHPLAWPQVNTGWSTAFLYSQLWTWHKTQCLRISGVTQQLLRPDEWPGYRHSGSKPRMDLSSSILRKCLSQPLHISICPLSQPLLHLSQDLFITKPQNWPWACPVWFSLQMYVKFRPLGCWVPRALPWKHKFTTDH